MNEIVPESPEKDSEMDDENSYVPETPQTDGSPKIRGKIPIPSLSRIRKCFGVLDNNNTDVSTPSRNIITNKQISNECKNLLLENYKKNKKSLEKVKVSLFRNEPAPKEKSFALSAKMFYGSSNKVQSQFVLAPKSIKPVTKRTYKKKNPESSRPKLSARKRHRAGEINCGVAHGVKLPKRRKSSPKNDLAKIEKQIESAKKQVHQRSINNEVKDAESKANVETKEGECDPTKTFFKHKYSTKVNATNSPSPILSASVAQECNKINFVNQTSVEESNSNKQLDVTPQTFRMQTTLERLFNSSSDDSITFKTHDTSDPSISEQNVSTSSNVLENTCTESEEKTDISSKQKDVNDLLKILEDWEDDGMREDKNENTSMCEDASVISEEISESTNIFEDTNVMTNEENESTNIFKDKSIVYKEKEKNTDDINDTNMLYEEEYESRNVFKDTKLKNVIQNIYDNITSSENISSCTESNVTEAENTRKYYSLFYKEGSSNIRSEETTLQKQKFSKQSRFNNDVNQYQIDAGQKIFGAIQCKECNLIYHVGDKDDERIHSNYHNQFQMLKFQGWKNERVVFEDVTTSTRIILVEYSSISLHQKKILQILEVVNRDTGACDLDLSSYENKIIFLYVKNKAILGVLIAEQINAAFRMIPELIESNCCTSESSPAKCGINLVWTTKSHQRKGIATKLVDSLRSNYFYGHIMSLDDIAFSIPTPSGKSFAIKYTNSKGFKVY